MKQIALVAAAYALVAVPALADLTEYSVFGAKKVTTGASADIEGLLGSGGNVNLGYDSTVYGGGRAGGKFNAGGSFATPGDVIANGNLTLPWDSTVAGDVIAGGKISLGGNVNPGGITQSRAGTPYSPIPSLPAPTIFTAGGINQNVAPAGKLNLAPGTYGTLTTNNQGTVNLSAGAYFFDAIALGNAAKLNLNVTAGDILIYSLGNVTFNSDVDFDVIGGGAKDIYIETHGDFVVGYSGQVYGTVYASGSSTRLGESNIRTGSDLDFYGALYSDSCIDLGYQNSIHFEPSEYSAEVEMANPTPVPGAALLGLLGLGVAGAKLRKRR